MRESGCIFLTNFYDAHNVILDFRTLIGNLLFVNLRGGNGFWGSLKGE